MSRKEAVSLRGALGKEGVLAALRSCKGQSVSAKAQAEIALTEGWNSLAELMRFGGAIDLSGRILPIDNLCLPEDKRKRLQEELLLGISLRQFSFWSSVNTARSRDWSDRAWAVQLVAGGFATHLDYSIGKDNRARFSLTLPDGTSRWENHLRWLRFACRKHIEEQYNWKQVAHIVMPGVVTTQFLIEAANTWGRGRERIG